MKRIKFKNLIYYQKKNYLIKFQQKFRHFLSILVLVTLVLRFFRSKASKIIFWLLGSALAPICNKKVSISRAPSILFLIKLLKIFY